MFLLKFFLAGAHAGRAGERGAGSRRPADKRGEGKGEDAEEEGSGGGGFGGGRGQQHVQETQLEK